jgi:hypothetical protein
VRQLMLRRGTMSASKLGRELGIRPQTIYNILSGRSWKRLTGLTNNA